MTYRFARIEDCELLGEWNHKLIRDEGHRNPMTVSQLVERMRGWLAGDYKGIIFERDGVAVGYALFREGLEEIYLRQLFIVRDQRRKGVGRAAVEILQKKIWPKDKRLTVEVLVENEAAVRFWRRVGYKDYAITLEILPER